MVCTSLALLMPTSPKPLLLLFPLFLGIPMDVDAAQKTQPLLLHNYYHCGEIGHLVKDCPYQLDV